MSSGNSSPTPSPKTRELLRLFEQLEQDERYSDVIRLAEAWAHQNPLPREASLAQARAFLSLKLMDRAWVRLRELTDSSTEATEDIEPLLLTADMFLERGWPARARKVLQRAGRIDATNSALPALAKRAAAPPLRPPPNARELERHGTPEQLVFLAERYLATGSMLRGKSLLERVRRLQPGNSRVEQLLWGVKGDFIAQSGRGQSLVELVAELGSDQSSEWDAVENTESINFSDITAAGIMPPSAPETDRGDSFPLLFRRRMVIGEGEEEDAEVTISARLASIDEMADAPEMESTDPGIAELEEDPDTRIMEFISNRNGEVELVPAISADDSSSTRPERRAVDLRALSDSEDDAELEDGSFLEDEDEDLVVMTRREGGTLKKVNDRAAGRRTPIEVIEKHPTPPPQPPELHLEELDSLDPDDFSDVRPQRGNLVVLFGLGAVVSLGVIGLYVGMQHHAEGELVDETHQAIATGDFQSIRALEARLDGQVQAGVSPIGTRAVELALLNAVLWSDYTGDPEDLTQAETLLVAAEAEGAPAAEIALTQGVLALGHGDVEAAAVAAALVDADHAEGRYLQTRVAMAQGKTEDAETRWGSEPPDGARYAVVLPLILAQSGRQAEIPPMLAEPGVLLQIAADENRWIEEDKEERLSRVGALLKEELRGLSPRHRARLLAVQAELNEELGREAAARRAWQQALDSDGYHPRYLYEIAGRELTGGHPLDAYGRLSRCIASHPADQDCQRAALMALLELDRIKEAQAQVESWDASAGDASIARVWLAVAEGRAGAALEMLDGMRVDGSLGDDGLAWYLSGLARGHQGDAAAGADLEKASALLAEASAPEIRMLTERARAARVEYGPRSTASRLATALRTEGSLDPVVHLHLGRYFERLGRRTDATQHFARAGQLAEQNGRVLFELGRVYYGPKTTWAFDLWRRYLELIPSGERAEQTKKRITE